MFVTTALYAALLAIIFLILTARVILYRRANQIGLGDAGDKSLIKRIRAQANFIEYVPVSIILLGLLEAQNAPAVGLHVMGLMALIGRGAHAYGFSTSPQVMPLRVAGVAANLTMIGLSALWLLGLSVLG